jgi:raffinose/stachyose/melibiose transport system permease protein
MLIPTIKSAVVMSVVGSLKYFDLVYVMTNGGPGTSTELMATYMYKNSFVTYNMGYGSAIAAGMFILITAIATIIMRVMNSGGDD